MKVRKEDIFMKHCVYTASLSKRLGKVRNFLLLKSGHSEH